jgi:hypothetical protein
MRAMSDTPGYLGRGGGSMEALAPPTQCEQALASGGRIYFGMPTGPAIQRDVPNIGRAPPRRPLRLLLSYFYYRDEDIQALLSACFPDRKVDLFADSGAFSAFTTGTPVGLDGYAEWLNRWGHLFTCAAGFDVIGDPAATQWATEELLRRVSCVQILPVFHLGEDPKYLQHWFGRTDYLAFGGMVPHSARPDFVAAWLRQSFAQLPPDVRVHGFGMTSWNTLKNFPWYSVDSSSWTAPFRYASLPLFNSQRSAWEKLDMRDHRALLKAAPLLSEYRLRPSQCHAGSYDRDLICGASVEAWQRAEEWLNKRRAKNNLYLSCGALPMGGHGDGTATCVSNGMSVYLATISGDAPNSLPSISRSLKKKESP